MFEKKLIVIIGGYEDNEDEYTQQTIEITEKELKKILPELIHCMCDSFLPVIENLKHPFNGWQIQTVEINKDAKPEIETEEDQRWEKLSQESKAKGLDLSNAELDENGHFKKV